MFKPGPPTFKSIMILIWLVFSLIFYGIACLISRLFSEKAANKIAYWWLLHLYYFSGCRINLTNLDKLDRDSQYIFLANHQSIVDILVLYLSLPFQLSFIAKKSLFYIPLFGWCIFAVGHVAMDRSNPQNAKKSIQKACVMIEKKKRSIFAFPEGTRSLSNKMGEFKLGIFSLAIQTGLDIVPVTINGTGKIMPKKAFFIHPGQIDIFIHDPISISQYNRNSKAVLADKTWKIIQSQIKHS